MDFSTAKDMRLVCALVVLGVALIAAPGAQASAAGTMFAWGCAGSTNSGQCAGPGDLSDVVAIDASHDHSLALKSDGTVVAWGCTRVPYGQCAVPPGLSGVKAIAAGGSHSLAVKSDGTVVAWGCYVSDEGQCDVPPGLTGVTAVSAGLWHSLALKSDGTVAAWGCGGGILWGQCSVPSGLSGVTAVAAGTLHSLALRNDGSVVAWGCGLVGADYGQCTVPGGLSGVTAIAAGGTESVALKSDGTVVVWGCGADRALCTVPTGLADVVAIDAGADHIVAVKGDGNVVVWGCGVQSAGQCNIPAGVSGATAVAAGWYHSLAWQNPHQQINFRPLSDRPYGAPDFIVAATASSGLPVSLVAGGTCVVTGATVHLTGAGSCTITAAQAGNASYDAAAAVARSFAVAKANQTIAFASIARKTFGARDFGVTVSATSGLPVALAAAGSCTVRGTTVHLTRRGSCAVTASQPGDANYEAASDVKQTFSVAPASCTVPDVVGKRLPAARRAIVRSHCGVGKVRSAESSKRTGLVISQSRPPKRVLPAGSRIDLVVARGRGAAR